MVSDLLQIVLADCVAIFHATGFQADIARVQNIVNGDTQHVSSDMRSDAPSQGDRLTVKVNALHPRHIQGPCMSQSLDPVMQ